MVYSTLHLGLNRRKGLVTSGPYRFARHPQYLGMMVFSVNLTSRCYRETLGDVGWLGPGGTLLVWFATMVAYILLALVEELHLRAEFGQPYVDYSRNTAFLIPFLRTRRRWLEAIVSLVIPMLLLGALALLRRMLYP